MTRGFWFAVSWAAYAAIVISVIVAEYHYLTSVLDAPILILIVAVTVFALALIGRSMFER